MKYEDAKAIFLLEHCAERCDGYQKDDVCENCEINAAIKALDKMTELKKCPFCGWGTIVDGGGFFSHACECNACHAKTKNYKTWEEAVEAWNRRAE